MTTTQRDRRTLRKARFSLECLDDRIVPSAMHAGAAHLAHHVPQHVGLHAGMGGTAAVPVFNVPQGGAAAGSTVHTLQRPSGGASPSVGPVRPHPPVNPVPIVPANPAPANPVPTTPTQPGNPNPNPGNPSSPGPLPANVSAPLQSLYAQYQNFVNSGGSGTFTPTGVNPLLMISGTNVGVSVHANNPGDFASMVAQLQKDGMQIIASNPTIGTVQGMVSIANLPAIAQLPQAPSVAALFSPVTR